MKVRNLVSWAGPHFSVLPGEIIDLDETTAQDRIAAGLAELPVAAEPEAKTLPDAPESHKRIAAEQADRRRSAADGSARATPQDEKAPEPDAKSRSAPARRA